MPSIKTHHVPSYVPPPAPVLTYAGPANGSIPFGVGAVMNFPGGVTTFTVNVPVTVACSAAGAGWNGQFVGNNTGGGNGGGSGAVGANGASAVLSPGVTYRAVVPLNSTGVPATVGVNGGANFIAMGSANGTTAGAPITGTGVAGRNGALGGGEGGSPGAINGGGAGSGGSGGAQGGSSCGWGGSGGGMNNAQAPDAPPPHQSPCFGGAGGRGLGVSIAGNGDASYGGGGGSSGDPESPWGGHAGGQSAGGHGAAGVTRTA